MTPLRTAGTRPDGTSSGSGVVAGWGTTDGSPVVVISHDAAVASGAIGAVMAEAIMKAQRFAIDRGHPIVYINDSGGARVPDGIFALHGCGGIFALNVKAQKRVPQISLILGPCAGAAAYSPALTDWTVMVKGQGQMFLTGPDIVKAATGEDATAEEIGGSQLHSVTSGVAHLEVASEIEAFEATRLLLSFLPEHKGAPQKVQSAMPANPFAADKLPTLVPEKSSVVFDMNALLDGVLDNGARLELMPEHAPSILTLFGRLDGRPVGVVANQPASRGGILDSKASVKLARFVEFCGRFDLPVLTFVDVPGFLPGTVEESRGVITHGAKVLKAYAETESPKLTVVVRKAFGGAYIAMGAASLGADVNWAWSGSEIAVMGPGGAVALLNRRELAASDDPAGSARHARRCLPRRGRASVPGGRGRHRRRRHPSRGDPSPHGRCPAHAQRGQPPRMISARAEIVGNIWKITSRVGDQVAKGDTVAVLESMKMEIPVVAPAGGHVSQILVEINQIVQEGDPIVEIDDTASA